MVTAADQVAPSHVDPFRSRPGFWWDPHLLTVLWVRASWVGTELLGDKRVGYHGY
jgi:hypothetical protein